METYGTDSRCIYSENLKLGVCMRFKINNNMIKLYA